MGLIKAGMGALGGTFADQWREFFYCESMPKGYSLQKDKNVSPDVQRTPKEMTILSRTALELL